MGPSREPTTHDLLAERRARRPEGEDAALIRRAEAAEAAARNLEAHLATLERRLAELGQEREQLAERLSDRELELRNVKQREYAEQQLRVQAESSTGALQRETQAQVQELRCRLEDTERRAAELTGELEAVRHELSEARQALAVASRARELELQSIRERDSRLVPIVRELMRLLARLRSAFAGELGALRQELARQAASEREAYARELTAMSAQLQSLRIELTGAVAELRLRVAAAPSAESRDEGEELRRREMSEALAAAVERLRARAAELENVAPERPPGAQPAPADARPAPAEAQPAAAEELMAGGASAPADRPAATPERKMSRFARWRAARRLRRAR